MIFQLVNNLIGVGLIKVSPVLMAASSGGEHESGPPHLPNIFSLLYNQGFISENVYHFASNWINVIFAFATGIILCIISMRIYAKRQMIPGKAQNLVELLVEGMYNFLYTILGKDAKKYTPFIGTIFFYILINNIWGLIPLGHSPSTSINITASLAIAVFLYAQYTGIRKLG
ncbi:MAG: F0F1 ATP synthase subunit A, partial [Candidatus Zixiibacteriota bacterium]